MKNISKTVFPYKLEMEKNDSSITGFGGLSVFNEFFHSLNLSKEIKRHLKLKKKGWCESEIIETTSAMILSGGEHMSDVDLLCRDKAYQKVIRKAGGLPCAKTMERFLKRFHLEQIHPKDVKAWIPRESTPLKDLRKVSKYLVKKILKKKKLSTITLECDATIAFSNKETAYKTYKGGTGYAPMIGAIAEIKTILDDEFRPGNVPSNYKAYEFVKRCIKLISKKTKKKRGRFDCHFYQHRIINLLNQEEYEWAMTALKSQYMVETLIKKPEKDWQPLFAMTEHGPVDTGRDWCEFYWVSADGSSEEMDSRMCRYVATRKRHFQLELFDNESDRFEVIATNMDWRGDRLINWSYERCGSIEHIFKVLKNDLAGGVFPCDEFGANAAWWRIQCLIYNIIRAFQLFILPPEYETSRMKRLRYRLFCIPSRVITRSRQLILKLFDDHPSFELIQEARLRIWELSTA